LNFAALKRLPIIFICENNFYAINSRQLDRQLQSNICDRARVYGMPAERIENNDVVRIHEAVSKAAREIRAGEGPRFFECMTYRWKEHVGPGEDYGIYRERSEAEPWMENDQVKVIGNTLPWDVRQQIENEVETEIREAFEFAEQSPFPDPAELYTDVLKE